ncbi:putative bifunctional diguanylate cyclase/phosphodiesterase [Cryobacterium tepidiphilum]|uniref:EAL domain-containing protein n=1 Tax=Cryobacterium tepidiphilum TaxID=2486026 RepID=A0A3M8LPD6_9MICO|nr:EAL domain-containing protein [Cryobacterium tepidiphilum]RNE66722.1 EAL domain-containing protein [Cryobacterium tepidiphilum]
MRTLREGSTQAIVAPLTADVVARAGTDKLRALQGAAGLLVSAGTLEDVLDRIVAAVDDAVPAPGHVLAVQLPGGSTHTRWRGDAEAAAEALVSGRREALAEACGGRFLAAPVASQTRTYGTLVALAPQRGHFTADDAAMLTAYANHAAAGIEMKLLLAEAREQYETAQLLLDVARALSGQCTVDAVSQAVAEAALTLSGADRSGVALWDTASGELRFNAWSGWDGVLARKLADFVLMEHESPELRDLVANRSPLLINADSSEWAQGMLEHFELEALAAVPIVVNGDLGGLVVVHWGQDAPNAVEEALSERLSGLAGLTSVALENARLMEEARWKNLHDPLTGLANRTLFEERLQAALYGAVDTRDAVGVLFCDINRFKRVNDSLGHGAGDEVLRQVAARLLAAVGDDETVARISGDEFVILVPGAEVLDRIDAIVGRVREQLAHPLLIAGEKLFVDVAIGVATSDGPSSEEAGAFGEPTKRMIELADLRMYQSKARMLGRLGNEAVGVDTLRLETELRGAAGRGELRVHYQPQFDLGTDRIVGVEALVRWAHPEIGMISPATFIPLAEESGLIREVGAFVLGEALRVGAGWHAVGFPIDVAVNVSVAQLSDPEFLPQLKGVLADSRFPAASLTIELTESQVVTDHTVIAGLLRELRGLGVAISIDDFGTGFSSLAQLQRMPVTEIKIDQAFTAELTSTSTSPFVSGIVGLGRGLALRVIAEGVETDEQLQALRRAGCDRAQGYLLGRPTDAATILHRLKESA